MCPLITHSEKCGVFTLAWWNEVKPSFQSLPRTPYVKTWTQRTQRNEIKDLAINSGHKNGHQVARSGHKVILG